MRYKMLCAMSILLVFMLIATEPAKAEAKEDCEELIQVAREVSNQLPLQVDYMTRMVAMNAVYLRGHCVVSFGYSVDEDALIKEIQYSVQSRTGSTPSKHEIIRHLNSEAGRQELREAVFLNLPPNLRELAEWPLFILQMTYSYTGANIKPFFIELD
ncbi:hypothetical protein [Desulfurivibrio sp. C05AmB]|uniref:hypothetical protein n=1 Tax=Desulfurivibrio sp. C05AmB TaxID=3374371 RepID=UPI00376F1F69